MTQTIGEVKSTQHVQHTHANDSPHPTATGTICQLAKYNYHDYHIVHHTNVTCVTMFSLTFCTMYICYIHDTCNYVCQYIPYMTHDIHVFHTHVAQCMPRTQVHVVMYITCIHVVCTTFVQCMPACICSHGLEATAHIKIRFGFRAMQIIQ